MNAPAVKSMAYVGRMTCCQALIMAVVDDADSDPKWVSRQVASAIRSGLTVERVTVEAVRQMHFGPRHIKGKPCPNAVPS